MDFGVVSELSIVGMVVSCIISCCIPIALMLYLFIKKKADMSYFLMGCLVFTVFVLILEAVVNSLVIKYGIISTDNIVTYALYGGIMAALFEESGRYLALRYVMKDKLSLNNSLMYGVGHGGIEAIMLVGLTNISNIANSILINNGDMQKLLEKIDPLKSYETVDQLSLLWKTPAYQFFCGGVERIAAIVIQISLSVLIYMAIRYGKKRYIAIAVIIHIVVDFASVMIGGKVNVAVAVAIVCVMATVIGVMVKKQYSNYLEE